MMIQLSMKKFRQKVFFLVSYAFFFQVVLSNEYFLDFLQYLLYSTLYRNYKKLKKETEIEGYNDGLI